MRDAQEVLAWKDNKNNAVRAFLLFEVKILDEKFYRCAYISEKTKDWVVATFSYAIPLKEENEDAN